MPWRRWTVARQIVFITLASIIVAHMVAGIIIFRAGPPPAPRSRSEPIAVVLRLLAAAQPSDSDAIMKAAARAGVPVRRIVTTATASPADAPSESGQPALTTDIARRAGLPEQAVWIADDERGPEVRAVLHGGEQVAFSLRLPPDQAAADDRRWIGPTIDFCAGFLPLALVALWAARRVSGPLVRLAAAARHFGVMDDPAPLPVEGPGEIRDVSQALNGMLAKLHRFVVDRTRMLAAISHDLRTPLTRLRLRAEGFEAGPMREKMLEDLQRMESMIASTLAFIHEDEQQEKPEPVDIAVLAATICDVFADGGADVSYVGPLHTSTMCRPLAMERALTNVVDNAVKFGGSATVTLSPIPTGVMIDVEDPGPGIPDIQKEEMFKPFTRGDAARSMESGGTGLGLAIVRSIVQGHGGRIDLSDRKPHGLRVRITLPS